MNFKEIFNKQIFKNYKVVIPSVFFILIIVFGMLLYTRTINPSWNPFNIIEEKRIYHGIENSLNTKIQHYDLDGTLGFKLKNQSSTNLNINLTLSGDYDYSQDVKKHYSNLKIGTQIFGLEIALKAKAMIIGNDLYFYVSDIPELPLFNTSTLALIKNQWVKVPLQEKNIDQEFIKNLAKKLLLEKNAFQVKERYKNEKVNNVDCYHYLVTLNPENLKMFFIDLLKEAKASQKDIPEVKFQELIDNFSNNFEKNYKKIGDVNIEIWISKKDKLLTKVKFDKEIDFSQFSPKIESEPLFVDIKLESLFEKKTEKLEINPPNQYKLFQEIQEIEQQLQQNK
jgi:hypothetical protein